MKFKVALLSLSTTFGLCAATSNSYAATTATPPNSQVTMTSQEIQQSHAKQAEIMREYGGALTASNSSATSPSIVPGAPPPSGIVDTGTTTESDNGSTCGPIAAFNLLYHFKGSSTPSITTLETQLDWSSSNGTPFGSNWTSALNSDQSKYIYTAYSNPTTSDAFVDTAVAVGLSSAPDIFNIYGYLPGYQGGTNGSNLVFHYVTGRNYSGYGTGNPSQEDLGWYDESDENTNGHYITYSVAQLNTYESASVKGAYGTYPEMGWQGVVS